MPGVQKFLLTRGPLSCQVLSHVSPVGHNRKLACPIAVWFPVLLYIHYCVTTVLHECFIIHRWLYNCLVYRAVDLWRLQFLISEGDNLDWRER